jgi:uracil-DNA glycosylase family 4
MVKAEGPVTADIWIISDAPTDLDERTGRPLMGNIGMLLDGLLREAGISRAECYIRTISRDKPPGNNIGYFFEDSKCTKPKSFWNQELEVLRNELILYRPNIVIALGPIAMFYLTGNQGINGFRGYITDSTLVPGQKVIATVHPKVTNMEHKYAFQTVMDFRKAIANSTSPAMVEDKRELLIANSANEFVDYLNYILEHIDSPVGLDIETLSPGAHINIIGVAESSQRAMSFNFLRGKMPKYPSHQEEEVWYKIAEICKEKELIMQNGAYDSGVLWHNNGIYCEKFNKDIMLAAHACWPETPRSLGFLASICLNVPPWKHTSSETPELYNAADAANTVGIWNVLEKEMTKLGVKQTHDFEIAQIQVANSMQLKGILIDRTKQKELINETTDAMYKLEKELFEILGKKINYGSPKQLQSLLYIDMHLPVQYKRRKNSNDPQTVTADAEALTKLSRICDNPILQKILTLKKKQKLMTFLDITVSPENTVHTCYNITGATMSEQGKETVLDNEDSYKSFGRWSSSASIILPFGSGNLQNIPPEARKMYDAGNGKVFVQADYKQAEAVVVAYLIGDEKLKKLFSDSFGKSEEYCKENFLDVHRWTACDMFGVPLSDVTPAQRKVGKTIRHANNYSAGPGVLASKLGIPMKDAKELMTRYHLKCPQLRLWQEMIQNELRQSRCLTNLLGRKHKFLTRWGDDLFRSAYSFKPQSTVGDLLNEALVELDNEYGDVLDIAIQLHDAIYVRVDDNPEQIQFAKDALKDCMITRVQPLKNDIGEEFWIDVDYKVGRYWGDLKD